MPRTVTSRLTLSTDPTRDATRLWSWGFVNVPWPLQEDKLFLLVFNYIIMPDYADSNQTFTSWIRPPEWQLFLGWHNWEVYLTSSVFRVFPSLFHAILGQTLSDLCPFLWARELGRIFRNYIMYFTRKRTCFDNKNSAWMIYEVRARITKEIRSLWTVNEIM